MRSRKKLLILLVSIGVVVVIGGGLFLGTPYVLNWTRLVLESELEKRLKHPVAIDDISGDVLTGLNIKGVKIADPNPENAHLISLDEIQIKYRLWSLTQRKLLITRLHLNHPQINARMDAEGNLNLAKLIPKGGSGASAKLPIQLLISDISVSSGAIHFDDGRDFLRVAVSGIDSRSRVDGSKNNWKHTGHVEVQDGHFELNGVETQIDEFRTEFEVEQNRGVLQSLRLALGNSTLTVSGEVNNPSKQPPQVQTQIQVTLDFRDAQKILSLPGEIDGIAVVDVEAGGPVSEIFGRLGLSVPSIRLNGLEFENVVLQADFTPSTVQINQFDALIASGKLAGMAEIDLQFKEGDAQRLAYKGSLQLDSLRTEQLLPIIDFPEDFLDIKADLDGKIQFSGSGLDRRKIALDGDLQLDDASLNGVPIRPSAAYFQLNSEHLSITGNLDDAQIEINGKSGLTDPHDMDLRITKIDVGKLSGILQMPDLAGEGTLTGKSSAGSKNVEENASYSLRGRLSIPAATLYDVPIGVLTTDFRYTEGQVFLDPIRLVKGESELVARGIAHMEEDVPIELKVHAQPLQIADYVRLTGNNHPIEGVATGELVLDGTLAQLNGRGTLQIANGKAWELALDPLSLPIEIDNYVVKIPNFEVLTRGQKGILNAQIDPNHDYVIDFQSESMQLAEIALARGMTDFLLDADLIVTAKGQGNAADPTADLTFEFSNVTYAGHLLEDVSITGTYSDHALDFEGVGFNDTCQIRGVLESIEGIPYHITVDSVGVNLLPFLRIFNAADYLAGTADGNVEVTGTLEELPKFTFQMFLSKTDLDVQGRQLINPDPIRVSFADNLWHVQSLVIADKRDGSPFLNAMGTFPVMSELDGAAHEDSRTTNALSFTVEADRFPFEGVARLLGLPPRLSGNISYKLTGSGTYAAPQLALDWTIPNLAVRTPIGQITVTEGKGGFVYRDGNFTVDSFNLLLLGNPIAVRGDVQVDFNHLQSSRLNLHASCSNFELDSRKFQNFPDYLNNHLILFNLEVQITGNLAQPELSASIDATQETMQLLGFSQPIEDAKVALQISAGQAASPDLIVVELKSADWQFGGGNYQASGVWQLPKMAPELSLTSVIDNLEWHDSGMFQLYVNGVNVDPITPLNDLMKQEIFNVESRANIAFELQGNGYRPDQVSATLKCSDLRAKIHDHDVRNINEIQLHFTDGKLTLAPTLIGEGSTVWLNAAGTIDLDGNMDIHLDLDQLPYGVLLPAITLTLFDQSFLQFEGFLTSQIRVRGDLTNPIITADWESDGHVGNANLKDKGGASYKEKLLSIHNTQRIVGVSKQLEVSGTIPIDLAFQPVDFKDRFLDQPIDLKLQGQQISLVPIALLLHPLVEHADGIADIDLSIQGTTASPYPQGRLSFHRTTLKLANFDMPISNGRVELRADKGEIRIPTLSFQVGQGEYTAEMSCRLAGLIATDFEITRLKVHKARIADFIGDQSRWLNPVVSRFLNREAIGTEITSSEVLKGYITAEASLKIPVNQFLIPGDTAWIPKFMKPFNPPNVIKYVTGQLDIQNILIEGLGYQIRNSRPIDIQLVNQRLSLENGFSLEDQKPALAEEKRLRVTGFGSWELGKKLLFHVEMKNLDLGFISGFLPEAYAVRGSLNSSLDIRGTDAEPKISLTWDTPELRINKADVDQFAGSVKYEDRKIRISGKQNGDAHLSIGKNHAALSLLIPFHLSLLEFKAEPLPENIEGGLDVAIGDLEFLSLIFPQFAFTEGTGALNATLGGRFDSPVLKGSTNLRALAFDLPNSHIRLENGLAHLDLTEKGVNIRGITGDMNNGAFEISGVIQSDWFDVKRIDVVAALGDGTTFEKPGFYQLKCQDVNLQMKGAITTDGTLKLPPLKGSIRLKEGLYKQDWRQLVQDLVDKTADVQFEVWFDYPIVRNLQLDLDIIAPNNFWVESNLGEVFTSIGEIEIETSINGELVGPIQKPIFTGRVDLLKGELALSGGHQLEIQEGSYAENRSALEFNPWYDITAETVDPIRNVAVPATNGQIHTRDLRVTMHLSGYLKEKQLPEFRADVLGKGAGEAYELNHNQILPILMLGGSDPLERVFGNVIESSRIAKVVGFSETRVDLSPDNFEQSRFHVTKELSERLSLTYSSTFQLHTEPRIEVEYQISRLFYIKGERNERGKYGVDLKVEQRF